MSFCRWSSDDFQCDIYAYESVHGGYCVHVASNRPIFTQPLPPPVNELDARAWIERHEKVSQMMRSAEHKEIGLTRDGTNHSLDTAQEAVDLLESLKAEGYNVPEYAIQGLREDAAEESAH